LGGGKVNVAKKYAPEYKQQIIKEANEVGNNSIVAMKYDINQNIVSRWVGQLKNNGTSRRSSLRIRIADCIEKEQKRLA
jgi:transposase-like protein